jgi:very-short-patch-repair endonuclease
MRNGSPLALGERATIVGTVILRRVIRPREGGQPLVKATVDVDDGPEVNVVWWEAGRAPSEGRRVKVEGRVREFQGQLEIHADEWSVERTTPSEDPVERLLAFYIGCVEAEAAGSVRVQLGSDAHLELSAGPSPVLGRVDLPSNRRVARWCQQRGMGIGETVLGGWPLVIGTDAEGGRDRLAASPLFVCDLRLEYVEDSDLWRAEPDGWQVEFNPYALDLLGLARDERDALTRLIATTPAVDEAKTTLERIKAILGVLRDEGIDLEDLDPEDMESHDGSSGVHNTGLLMVASGSTQMTRMLLADLDEMRENADICRDGPAGVLLGQTALTRSLATNAHPIVVPSTLAQDQAVSSAMENVLTVVTGPPGTGKSQVLVNVVAAAVARGESVVFASKNNQAVDVVFERLVSVSPEACIIRAGTSARRGDVAASIRRVLAVPVRSVDPLGAERAWEEVRSKVEAVHQLLRERQELEAALERNRAVLAEQREALPTDVELSSDSASLDRVAAEARDALDAFGGRLGLLRRWSKHRRRVERARMALRAVGELIGLSRDQIEHPLASAIERPRRSLAPRHEFGAIEDVIAGILALQRLTADVERLQTELDGFPHRREIEDQLHELSTARIEAGQAVLSARWEQARRDRPEARKAAGELAELLLQLSSGGIGTRRAQGLVKEGLSALPVWGVANLSARTNLPLVEGLFDLVVIDESSQCDLASALPLLARARRALVIGDRYQLTHITSLSQAREAIIGARAGLKPEEIEEFSYRAWSCFSMASSRVDESPLFLDLHFRSHPGIIGFSNDHFYDGRLEFCADSKPPKDLPPIEWVRVDGDCMVGPKGRSRVNRDEARAVAAAVAASAPGMSNLGLSVGVVTPYRAQAELIRSELVDLMTPELAREVVVATAYRFQGDERDVIYFSPVAGPSMTPQQAAFAADPNLVNVALTRARRRLVVIGNMSACLEYGNVLTSLARYVSRLEAGPFDSPLELALYEALLDQGVAAETGVWVAGNRLDLAIQRNGRRIDLECDGAAFHTDKDKDEARDRAIRSHGWDVIRFSGRRLSRELDACVAEILAFGVSG